MDRWSHVPANQSTNWKRLLFLSALLLGASSGPSTAALDGSRRSVPVSTLEPLLPGVTLPVQVGRTLRAGRVRVGTKIVVKTTQRIPVSEVAHLERGAVLMGEVTASDAGDGTAAKPSVLRMRFTELQYRHQTVPIITRAIAVANFVEVDDTFAPAGGGPDRGNNSPASWTTRQVGGDEVARSGWIGDLVNSSTQKVGTADYYGVYSLPVRIDSRLTLPRALGVFSVSSHGLYGFDDACSLRSAEGEITLSCPSKLIVRDGDNLLLEVGAR